MSDNSVLARARRARPQHPVQIGAETFTLRAPSMAAVREFQEAREDPDPIKRVARILQECLVGPSGEADLTEADAREIAEMSWMNAALIRAILDIAQGGTGSTAPTPDDDLPAAISGGRADAGGLSEKQPDAG